MTQEDRPVLVADLLRRIHRVEAWGRGMPLILEKAPQVEFENIADLLSSTPALSIPEIAQALAKSESAVERAIRKLRENILLRRIGPEKGGHWEVLK